MKLLLTLLLSFLSTILCAQITDTIEVEVKGIYNGKEKTIIEKVGIEYSESDLVIKEFGIEGEFDKIITANVIPKNSILYDQYIYGMKASLKSVEVYFYKNFDRQYIKECKCNSVDVNGKCVDWIITYTPKPRADTGTMHYRPANVSFKEHRRFEIIQAKNKK